MGDDSVPLVAVALSPRDGLRWTDRVVIVVDELRMSSAVVTLFDHGCAGVIPVARLEAGRAEARRHGYVLAGSRGGLRPPGYDYGGSPVEFARADVRGKVVVLRTRNGTSVVGRLREAKCLLLGCLLNAGACAELALQLAIASQAGIGIICSGWKGSFALDDAVAAGALVDELCKLADSGQAELTDAAKAARCLWRSCDDPVATLRESASGQLLERLGLAADIEACARVNASSSVPVLEPGRPPRFAPTATVRAGGHWSR